jgi:hypothetical protein
MMTQAAAGVVCGLSFMNCGIFFAVITFRLDRDAAVTQALSDLAWLYLTLLVPMLVFQDLLVGMLVRGDRRERPVVPTWLGWANWVLPIGWFGAWGSHCVHNGPFAWDGAITFWLTVVFYLVQITLNTVYLWVAAGECDL